MHHLASIAHFVGGERTGNTDPSWHDDRIVAEAALAEQRERQRKIFLDRISPRALLDGLARRRKERQTVTVLRRLMKTSPHLLADIGLDPLQWGHGRIDFKVLEADRRSLSAAGQDTAEPSLPRLVPRGPAQTEPPPALHGLEIAAE